LVVARENLHPALLAGLLVLELHDLGVVLKYVRETLWREDSLPEVVGLQSLGVWWIACPVVPSLIEWQKPRGLAFEIRAEPHLVFIDRDVSKTASEVEQ